MSHRDPYRRIKHQIPMFRKNFPYAALVAATVFMAIVCIALAANISLFFRASDRHSFCIQRGKRFLASLRFVSAMLNSEEVAM